MTRRDVARLAVAALVLDLALIQPNHPQAMTWGALRLFPLELPVIVLALVAWPGPARMARAVLVAAITAIAALKLADLATFTAFGRGFDVTVDLHLVASGWRLGSGAVGTPLAALAVVAAVAALLAVAAALWWATGVWAAVVPARGLRRLALGGALASVALAGAEIGLAMRLWPLPFTPPGAAFTARVGIEHAVQATRSRAELAAFRAAAETDAALTIAAPLARLAGRDVLVVFVESYARASFDNPLYAPSHRAVLDIAAGRLAAAGLAVRTGWLTSPIEGGQSWLAHATLSSGMRVADETRYGALAASPRRTLYQFAQGAGWRTTAVSPAVTMPWPEAARLGFDTVLDRDAMGYRGQPFNWITMPDQFTLARFRERLAPDPRPLFAQVTLISSHAPWVPVPQAVPWDALGDGTVFTAMARAGDPPEVVWRDPARIRDQYRRSIAYSLDVAFDWAARQATDPLPSDGPLILILGDHPPVDFVSQIGRAEVPVHLIGPPGVVALADAWGWSPGLIPAPDARVWPMEAFRDRFLATFSGAEAP